MPILYIFIIIFGSIIFAFIIIIIVNIVRPRKIHELAALVKQNRTNQAIRMAKKIISKEPRSADAHYLLGLCYLQDEKPELALMEFKTVNQINNFTGVTNEITFRKQIADLYIQFNQIEEALKEYLLLIKIEPQVAANYYTTGDLFEERGRADVAIKYFQKAIDLDNKYAQAHFRLGKLFYQRKKPVDAKLELERSIKLDPANYKAHFYYGKLKKDAHDYVNALLYFDKARNDDDLKVKSFVERGTCFIGMNNHENAIIELERAINTAEDDTQTVVLYGRYFLALCYEKTRRIEKAIEQWEKIYATKPSFRDVAEKLSQYQELRTDDRVKDFLTASKDKFFKICEAIAKVMNLEVWDLSEITNGCQVHAVEAEQKWRGARKMPKLIHIYRVPEIIDETSVRILHEAMKKAAITKGVLITSSTFSRKAMEFAETRPINLYNKDKLRELLATAELEE